MRYFDFHCHILLKQLFAENPDIGSVIEHKDVATIPRNCTDLPVILQAQIHQNQLDNFDGGVIAGVVLYGLESSLAGQAISLRDFLRPSAQAKMFPPLFTAIADAAAEQPYRVFDLFTRERTLDNYLQDSLFNVLKRGSFAVPLPKNKISVFFVVEGCHSLVNSSLDFLPGHPTRKFAPQEILQNLDKILEQVPVLSVNLTHLQQSNLCNHAFGMQLADSQPFYPTGNGLTNDGSALVQGLFDRGVNVDVKHMSYKSRQDLYQAIDRGNFKNVQHIHCTHAGFTGLPFTDWTGYIHHIIDVGNVFYVELAKTMQTKNKPRVPGAPAFNATTINLFDEEIAWIVRHGGMIGLSMDRRIMGYVDPHDVDPMGRRADSVHYVDKEFFSKAEWAALGLGNKAGHLIEEDDCITQKDVDDILGKDIQTRNDFFCDHILLQLKHFLQVCHNAGIDLKEAQKHITVGSDYDGMINPFINLSSVEDMPLLKQYILNNFGHYLNSLKDSKKWAKQLDIPAFVEGLFYENGYRYVKSFFGAV